MQKGAATHPTIEPAAAGGGGHPLLPPQDQGRQRDRQVLQGRLPGVLHHLQHRLLVLLRPGDLMVAATHSWLTGQSVVVSVVILQTYSNSQRFLHPSKNRDPSKRKGNLFQNRDPTRGRHPLSKTCTIKGTAPLSKNLDPSSGGTFFPKSVASKRRRHRLPEIGDPFKRVDAPFIRSLPLPENGTSFLGTVHHLFY